MVGEPAGREAGGQLNGREPRTEEVRAEADDVARRVDPVGRNRVESERDLVRRLSAEVQRAIAEVKAEATRKE